MRRFIHVEAEGRRSASSPPWWIQNAGYSSWVVMVKQIQFEEVHTRRGRGYSSWVDKVMVKQIQFEEVHTRRGRGKAIGLVTSVVDTERRVQLLGRQGYG